MPSFPEKKEVNIPNQAIQQFIVWWDSVFFIDLLYRKNFNIRFNSSQHRELNFIDMKIELEEAKFFQEFGEELRKKRENLDQYKITKKWLNPPQVGSISEMEFNTIDLSKMKKQYKEEQQNLTKAKNGK